MDAPYVSVKLYKCVIGVRTQIYWVSGIHDNTERFVYYVYNMYACIIYIVITREHRGLVGAGLEGWKTNAFENDKFPNR